MAEAYCGPSTALQNLQKHSAVDRSLQQDRLFNRRDPHESFRSIDPRAGILDHDFDAFLATKPQLGFVEQAPQDLFQLHSKGKQASRAGPPPAFDWAADFQRLQLATPGSSHAYAVPQRPTSLSFGPHASTPTPMQGTGTLSPFPYQTRMGDFFGIQAGYGVEGGLMSHGQGPMLYPSQRYPAAEVQPVIDDAAFDRAFMEIQEADVKQADVLNMFSRADHARIPTSYPQLPLLRLDMTSCFMNPTPGNLHRAAIGLALLEEHDMSFMTEHDLRAIHYMSNTFGAVADLPSARAYDFRSRLQALADDAARQVGGTSGDVGELKELYRNKLRSEFMFRYTSQPALVDELQADVRLQLAALAPASNLTERVLSVLGNDIANTLQSLRDGALSDADSTRILDAYVAGELEAAGVSRRKDWIREPRLDRLWQSMSSSVQEQGMENIDYDLRPPGTLYGDHKPLDQNNQNMEEVLRDLRTVEETGLQNQVNEDDDLARTAGELLSKLEHDRSAKFQASTFLELMRKLRDGQAKVEGDKVVDTAVAATSGHVPMVPDHRIGPDTGMPPARSTETSAPGPAQSTSSQAHSDVAMQTQRDGLDVVDLLNDPLSSTWNDSQGPPGGKRREAPYDAFR